MGRAFIAVIVVLTGACASYEPLTRGPPGHTFGGAARIPLTTVREDLLVPQAHTGSGLGLALGYAAALGDGALRADLGVAARYVVANYGARALVFEHGLRVRHTFMVDPGSWHVGVGPALGWETDVGYFETWDDAHAYWLTDRWLGPAVSAWRSFDDGWRLDLSAELMLLGIQSRRPGPPLYKQDPLDELLFYFRAPQRDPRFAWLGDTQRLRLGLDVWRTRSLTALPTGWALGGEARVAHASVPESIIILEVALRFTWMWGFP